ncbi:MAG TPA: hypothetical protein DHV51_01940 [Opitutae bacterium]|nr:hypothetical protein [Opitutae bacterium]
MGLFVYCGTRVVWFQQQITQCSENIRVIEERIAKVQQQTQRMLCFIAKMQTPAMIKRCVGSTMRVPSLRQIVYANPNNAVKLAKEVNIPVSYDDRKKRVLR